MSFLHLSLYVQICFVNIVYNLGFLTQQFSVQRFQIYPIENMGQTITMRDRSKLVLDEADWSINDAWCAH